MKTVRRRILYGIPYNNNNQHHSRLDALITWACSRIIRVVSSYHSAS